MQSGTSPTYGTNKVKNFLRKTAHNLRESAYKARASIRSFFNMTTSSGRCVNGQLTWTLDSSSCTGSFTCETTKACCDGNTVKAKPTSDIWDNCTWGVGTFEEYDAMADNKKRGCCTCDKEDACNNSNGTWDDVNKTCTSKSNVSDTWQHVDGDCDGTWNTGPQQCDSSNSSQYCCDNYGAPTTNQTHCVSAQLLIATSTGCSCCNKNTQCCDATEGEITLSSLSGTNQAAFSGCSQSGHTWGIGEYDAR